MIVCFCDFGLWIISVIIIVESVIIKYTTTHSYTIWLTDQYPVGWSISVKIIHNMVKSSFWSIIQGYLLPDGLFAWRLLIFILWDFFNFCIVAASRIFHYHGKVTSMLVTDVEDQMCWWQVWDVGDRYRMLVTDLIHQYLKSVTIIKSPT